MADTDEQTNVRYVCGIIAEDADKYEIDWEPDDETGEQLPSSWVLKSDVNVDQEIIDMWEAHMGSTRSLLRRSDAVPELVIRSAASAANKDWAARWTRVFNDVLKTAPYEDHPLGCEYFMTPVQYWEEALRLCVKFQDDAKAKGYLQEGGRKWIKKQVWKVEFTCPFEAQKAFQALVEVAALALEKELEEALDDVREGPLDRGLKVLDARATALSNGQ